MTNRRSRLIGTNGSSLGRNDIFIKDLTDHSETVIKHLQLLNIKVTTLKTVIIFKYMAL